MEKDINLFIQMLEFLLCVDYRVHASIIVMMIHADITRTWS